MGWVTIASLGFVFNKLGLDTVILILFIEGVSTEVFNASILVLKSSLCIALINYWC